MNRRFILMAISSCMLTALFPSKSFAQDATQRIEITAQRFNFTPGEIMLKKGQPVVLVLKSADVEHGLRIREFGVNATIAPGKTVEVKFTPSRVGDFIGHCVVFCGAGHGSMELRLHVVA